jgi:hypothetical protein
LRDVILLRKDVARNHWYRSWAEVVADAGGVDGVKMAQQAMNENGLPKDWLAVTPSGWACFYKAPTGGMLLHFQNY